MKMNITTCVDSLIYQEAKDKGISWVQALEFGIQFLIADKDGLGYPDCSLLNKVATMSRILREAIQAREEAEEKLKAFIPVPSVEEEIKDELKEAFKGTVE